MVNNKVFKYIPLGIWRANVQQEIRGQVNRFVLGKLDTGKKNIIGTLSYAICHTEKLTQNGLNTELLYLNPVKIIKECKGNILLRLICVMYLMI